MDSVIVLKNQAPDGLPLEATFLPGKGMNLISYKKGSIEVIDPSTRPLFEERFSGLGPLIGPHFHRRKAEILPKISDESLFPHIARVKAKGIVDPFSHGIARYAPWKATSSDNEVTASLSGKDTWENTSLASLEGQNFEMRFSATLMPSGLSLELSVVSDADSLVGLHYYYRLSEGKGEIHCQVADYCLKNGEKKPIPKEWIASQHSLKIPLENEAFDHTLYPHPLPRSGEILLKTEDYSLKTTYVSPSVENSFQLYHPKGASFVCIEPISANDPKHPNLTVSSLQVCLQIL